MKRQTCFYVSQTLTIAFTLVVIIFMATGTSGEAQKCRPSGILEGKHAPRGQCDPQNSDCCERGKRYKTYRCSPPVTRSTRAILTQNSFQRGGDGGGPSECDGKYHSDREPIVALSTGWYNKGKRCGKFIKVHFKGRSVRAKVVDECDSSEGCDSEHGYQPPCPNNVVDASAAVWKALRVPQHEWGWMDVTWSDA